MRSCTEETRRFPFIPLSVSDWLIRKHHPIRDEQTARKLQAVTPKIGYESLELWTPDFFYIICGLALRVLDGVQAEITTLKRRMDNKDQTSKTHPARTPKYDWMMKLWKVVCALATHFYYCLWSECFCFPGKNQLINFTCLRPDYFSILFQNKYWVQFSAKVRCVLVYLEISVNTRSMKNCSRKTLIYFIHIQLFQFGIFNFFLWLLLLLLFQQHFSFWWHFFTKVKFPVETSVYLMKATNELLLWQCHYKMK